MTKLGSRPFPRVSIITPVYNGARYVGEAIESVLAQTWHDWELIIIDDGSTDATPTILQSFADPRIVCLHQDNRGEAGARNTGLDRVRGEYVALLDADDLYLPSALADFVAYMDAHTDVDVVYSDGIICDQNKRPLMRLSEVRPGIYTGNILEALVLQAAVITVPVCTMTRRLAIERCGVRFDERMVIGPDRDFWIQLARHAQFGYLDKLTCKYRVHQTNIQRTTGWRKRTQDAIYLQMKVLNSDWFPQLSTTTQYQFFYQLLIGLLGRQTTCQETILESQQIKNLPLQYQAELWRHVGVVNLSRRSEQVFAISCLRRAVHLWPGDRKSRILLATSRLGDSVPYGLLRMWRVVHRVSNRLRSVGRRRPKPVPAALAPVTD